MISLYERVFWLTSFFFPPRRSILGTPDENAWPGVSSLPDFKSSFPQWSKENLEDRVPGLDPAGMELLEVYKNPFFSSGAIWPHVMLENSTSGIAAIATPSTLRCHLPLTNICNFFYRLCLSTILLPGSQLNRLLTMSTSTTLTLITVVVPAFNTDKCLQGKLFHS